MFRQYRMKIERPIDGMLDPLHIIGGVWFVGTEQASSHLIDTGDGLIMIDTGYQDTLAFVLRSIYEAGFKPTDIRYIINTHWHDDHTEATRDMARISGAKTLIWEDDLPKARQYFEPDLLIKDGDTLALGNTVIRFVKTPGHTQGTVSLFFDTVENGKTYRVGMFGGAGVNTLKQGCFDYPACREDYRSSIARLRREPVDVFIGNHTWNNNTVEFGRILKETGENRFLDGTLWGQFLDYCERRLEETIREDR